MSKQLEDLNSNHIWAITRLSLGFVFLWSFFDKFFGLGFSTCRNDVGKVAILCEKAVVNGGSASEGFLKFATNGPLESIYQSLAGNSLIDFLFMFGLLGVGLALVLGIFMRIATVGGVILLLMIYAAALPKEHNPLIDEHIIYSLVLIGLLSVNDNQTFGLGKKWANLKIVKSHQILR